MELAVNDSPPFSADVKNEWGYTSSPRICFHGVDKETTFNRKTAFTYAIPLGHDASSYLGKRVTCM